MEDINPAKGPNVEHNFGPASGGCSAGLQQSCRTEAQDAHLEVQASVCRPVTQPIYFRRGVEQNHVISNLRFTIPLNFTTVTQKSKSFPGYLRPVSADLPSLHLPKPESTSEESQSEDAVLVEDRTERQQETSICASGSKQVKKEYLKNVIKRIERSREFWQEYEKFDRKDWRTSSTREFLDLSKSLVPSTVLQQVISQKQCISDLEALALDCVSDLIFDQFGCHVLRQLLKRSPKVAAAVMGAVQSDRFVELCTGQFASKVLQTAAEQDGEAKIRCLDRMIEHWDSIKRSISANHLFKVLLYRTHNTEPHFLRVSSFVISRSEKMLTDKYDKRFLAVFLEVCSRKQLALVYKKSSIEKLMLSRGADKYLAVCFLVFVQRRYKKAEDYLFETLLHPGRPDNAVLKKLIGQIGPKLRASVSFQIARLFNSSEDM